MDVTLDNVFPVLEEMLKSGAAVCFKPNGVSMLPLLRQGIDDVSLKKTGYKKNDIVFYRRNDGHYVLHRIIKIKDGNYIMCGDNQWQDEYGITDNMIIAVVASIKRGGVQINMHGIRYRLYCKTLPLRRFALFCRHCAAALILRFKRVIKRILNGNRLSN